MKTTELPMVQEETISRMSKPRRQGELLGGTKHQPSSAGMNPIPIEWLDPECWRLPSGKALAEFALQAGFLAPLMLGLPTARHQRVCKTQSDAGRSGEAKEFESHGQAAPIDGNRKINRISSRSAGKRV
jgi:hypothetical protein